MNRISAQFSSQACIAAATIIAMFIGALCQAAPAEDHWSPDPDLKAAITQRQALDMINNQDYPSAISMLVNLSEEAKGEADVFNLLGYAYRLNGELAKSMAAYKRALFLKPGHIGALEYQGELFLTLGELKKAEGNLAKIKAVCAASCEEYKELKTAINRWRKNNH